MKLLRLGLLPQSRQLFKNLQEQTFECIGLNQTLVTINARGRVVVPRLEFIRYYSVGLENLGNLIISEARLEYEFPPSSEIAPHTLWIQSSRTLWWLFAWIVLSVETAFIYLKVVQHSLRVILSPQHLDFRYQKAKPFDNVDPRPPAANGLLEKVRICVSRLICNTRSVP